MKREQRAAYVALTDVELPNNGNAIIYTFCKYAKWEGWCEEAYAVCHHPLCRVCEDESDRINSDDSRGTDCWGFRPAYSREDCVDMVGCFLREEAVDMATVPRLGKRERVETGG